MKTPAFSVFICVWWVYNFHASWQPGKSHTEADTLSRAPADDPAPEDSIADSEIQSDLHAIIAANRLEAENDIHLVELAQLAENDEEYTQLREIILEGFPHQKSDLPVLVRPYWSVRDKLAVDDHLVLCGCRLVIPRQMRSDVLTTLHMSHQGIERTKRRARLSVYWPGIDNDITQLVWGCRSCSEHLPSLPKEPLKTHPSPDRVFEQLATDLFEYGGCHFLVVPDFKSGWPTTYKLGFTITASVVISALRQTFLDSAVPTVLYSDGGPQFTARAMDRFLQDWGVQHEMSSPHYPQSNGFAEAAVKAMKALVRQCWETNFRTVNADKWAKGLLQCRNTPRADGLSPAQVVYGHPVRDTLPVHKHAFAPEWQRSIKEADERAATIHHRLEHMYNRTAHELPQLAVGTKVAVQDHRTCKWDKYGTIVEVGRPLWRSVATATIWSVLPVGGFGYGTEDSSAVATLWPYSAATGPCAHTPWASAHCSSSPTPRQYYRWHAPAPHQAPTPASATTGRPGQNVCQAHPCSPYQFKAA